MGKADGQLARPTTESPVRTGWDSTISPPFKQAMFREWSQALRTVYSENEFGVVVTEANYIYSAI